MFCFIYIHIYMYVFIHVTLKKQAKYNFEYLNQSMQNKDLNEKLQLYQMKTEGLSIFLSGHRTAIYIFTYAQYMSQVVKDWQWSQVNNVVGDFVFLGVSF